MPTSSHFEPNPPLRTARLRLEPLSAAHAPSMFPVLDDERLYRFMPDLRLASVQDLADRYARQVQGSPDPQERWLNFIVFVGDTPQPIGFVQATVMTRRRRAELAYVLAPAQWGNGYAVEAVSGLIEHLRDTGTVQELQVTIDSRNDASLALARRLGFRVVGMVEEDTWVDVVLRRPLRIGPNPSDPAGEGESATGGREGNSGDVPGDQA